MFPYVKFTTATEHLFFHPKIPIGKEFKFSSDLEKIGLEWDVSLANGTYVELISDPIEITKEPYGVLNLIKVKADVSTDYHTIIREFYVPVDFIVKAEDYEIASSELPN